VTFPQLLLDTDILSAMMRKNLLVRAKGQSYLDKHGRFTFSIITRYEILRGLKVRQALKQTAFFDKFCARCTILPITDKVVHLVMITHMKPKRDRVNGATPGSP